MRSPALMDAACELRRVVLREARVLALRRCVYVCTVAGTAQLVERRTRRRDRPRLAQWDPHGPCFLAR